MLPWNIDKPQSQISPGRDRSPSDRSSLLGPILNTILDPTLGYPQISVVQCSDKTIGSNAYSQTNMPTSSILSVVNQKGQSYGAPLSSTSAGVNLLSQAVSVAGSSLSQPGAPLSMSSVSSTSISPPIAQGVSNGQIPQQQQYSQIQHTQFPPSLPPGVIINPSKTAMMAKKYASKAKNLAKPAGVIAGAAAVEAAGLAAGVDVLGSVGQVAKAYNNHKLSKAQRLRLQNGSVPQTPTGSIATFQGSPNQRTPSGQQSQPMLAAQQPGTTKTLHANPLQPVVQQNLPHVLHSQQPISSPTIMTNSPGYNQHASTQAVNPGHSIRQQQGAVQPQQFVTQPHGAGTPIVAQGPPTSGPLQIRPRKPVASNYANERPGGLPDMTCFQQPTTNQSTSHHQVGTGSSLKYPEEIYQAASKLQHLLEQHYASHEHSQPQHLHQHHNNPSQMLIGLLKKMLHGHQSSSQSPSSNTSIPSACQSPGASGSPSDSQANSTADLVQPQAPAPDTSFIGNINQGSAYLPGSAPSPSIPQTQVLPVDEFLSISNSSNPQSSTDNVTPLSSIPGQQEITTEISVEPAGNDVLPVGGNTPATGNNTPSVGNDALATEDAGALVDLSSLGGAGYGDYNDSAAYYTQETTVFTNTPSGTNLQSVGGVSLAPAVYGGNTASITSMTRPGAVYSAAQPYTTTNNNYYPPTTDNTIAPYQSNALNANSGTDFGYSAVQNPGYGTVANYPSVGDWQTQSTSISTQGFDGTSATEEEYTAVTDVTEVTQDSSDNGGFDTAPSLTENGSEDISTNSWTSSITNAVGGLMSSVQDNSNSESNLDDQLAGSFLGSSLLGCDDIGTQDMIVGSDGLI